MWDHADLDEVRRELRAQVERAILWGFDVSHLDSHMGTLQLRPEFFDVYLELAVEFGLPLRLSGASTERLVGFPFRQLAAEEGVLFPDHFVHVPTASAAGGRSSGSLLDLRPGVTEVYVHPAVDTPELRALAPDWAARVDDHHLLVPRRRPARPASSASGVKLIGFRELRDAPARRLSSAARRHRAERLGAQLEHPGHRAAGGGVEADGPDPADLGVGVGRPP